MPRATTRLENFTKYEVAGLHPRLKVMLQAMRYLMRMPIHVTSKDRPDHTGSAHAEGGVAVDISDNDGGLNVGSRWRHWALRAAYAVGFNRIGIADDHLHLDISTLKDKEVTWYERPDDCPEDPSDD